MCIDSVTGWINELADRDQQAAEQLWQHISTPLREFARQKLDVQIRRHYDEQDAANSAFHSLRRGLSEGRSKPRIATNYEVCWPSSRLGKSPHSSGISIVRNAVAEPYVVSLDLLTWVLPVSTPLLATSRRPMNWPKCPKVVPNCSPRYQTKQ